MEAKAKLISIKAYIMKRQGLKNTIAAKLNSVKKQRLDAIALNQDLPRSTLIRDIICAFLNTKRLRYFGV
jgi:predicted DNA-binding protein